MPDNAPADSGQNIKTEKPAKPLAVFASRGLWAIGIVGIVLLVGLGAIAYYKVGKESFRISFMVGSTLNLLIFVAILVQAFIYKRQWEAMQDGLDRTDKMIGVMVNTLSQNERAFEATWKLGKEQWHSMEGQLHAMEKQVITSESQMLIAAEAGKVMQGQLDAMKEQASIMQESLAETRRIFDVAERPIIVATRADIEGGIGPNKPLRPKVTFVNKGRTAAQNFKVTTEIAAEEGAVWALGFGDTGIQPKGNLFLPANDDPQVVIGAPAHAKTINGSLYNGVCDGREYFFIHGKGSYEDLAGKEWPIDYAFYFTNQYGFVPYPTQKRHDDKDQKEANPN